MLTKESGFDIRPLGELLRKPPFWPTRFKRIYTKDPQKGKPFLGASEAFMLRPEKRRWLAAEQLAKTDDYLVKAEWILMSRSGTVGRCRLVSPDLEQFFVSDDLIRLIPFRLPGYIYAFLSSWMGQALIKQQRYGATVTHIEPQHVEGIPVPIIAVSQQEAIHEQVEAACRLRAEANSLLDEAEALIYKELGLPPFDDSKVPYLFSIEKPHVFMAKASELEDRLDASYHVPRLTVVFSLLNRGKYKTVPLSKLGKPYIPSRFKRIYVAAEYGIPFLQGSHIPMIKPFDLKYLSRRAHANLGPWIIKSGWVMITCSGTIGRVAIVSKAYDGWAASQHIERIIPRDENHPGYIAAFLMTPYGQIQLSSKVYGGVVDELTEEDTANIVIASAPVDVQRKIGSLVVRAYGKAAQATEDEDKAISRFEAIMEEGFLKKGYTPFKPREKTLLQALRATQSANWEVPEEEVQADVEEAIRSVSERSEQR
jgi:type I restriction enzyme S subunit